MIKPDLSSKRAKLALRFFAYGVMTVATVVLSTILLFVALGYRLDKNFTFSQGGLMQFRSFPEAASVAVDGAAQDFKTPGKLNLAAGSHTIKMSLDGYRAWEKTVNLAAGELLWLNYTRFVPDSIVTSGIRDFDTVAGSLASPDRHWLLVQTAADKPQFVLADMSNEKEPKYTSFELPSGQLSQKDGKFGKFEIVEWDLGSRYVLVKHQIGDMTEFVRIDRSKPAEAVSLTQLFGLPVQSAHFSASNPNVVYAKTDTVLRRLDIGSKSASGVLVSNLLDFTLYGSDAVAFTAKQERTPGDTSTTQQIIGVLHKDKTTTVRTVGLDDQPVLAYSEYYNHEYLAVGSKASSKVQILRDPTAPGGKDTNSVFAEFDLGVPLRNLIFSSNGRLIVAQNGSHMASYDVETAHAYRHTFDFAVDPAKPLKWLDDYYLWTEAGNALRIVEFDGMNQREITAAQAGRGVMLSGNGKLLFSFGKNTMTNKYSLQASQMTVE